MAASQLDLIMSQVQQLSASEQLQIIKRVADLLERAERSSSIEERLAEMAADPDIQREFRQTGGMAKRERRNLPANQLAPPVCGTSLLIGSG